MKDQVTQLGNGGGGLFFFIVISLALIFVMARVAYHAEPTPRDHIFKGGK